MTSKKKHAISTTRISQLEALLKQLHLDYELNQWSKAIKKKNILVLNEALTHTSAQASMNHERLEFLGDAVLRLAASEFIEKKYPKTCTCYQTPQKRAIREHCPTR